MSNNLYFLLDYCYKRKPRCIVKDHNLDSQDSTLKVKYIRNYDNKDKDYKKIKLNPLFHKKKLLLPQIKYKPNSLRKEQFDSYSNENMDFFRLDYLCECNRNNYHNKSMDEVSAINRKENFEKFNEMGKNIKYLDYIKGNYILSQNKIINNNIGITKSNNNYNNPRKNNDFHKSNSQIYNSNLCGNNTFGDNKNYSNLYLMNMNDYSIKENDNFNSDTINKFSTVSPQKIPFYKAYYNNMSSCGFKKKESSLDNYDKNCGNRYFYRNDNNPPPKYCNNINNFNYNNHFNKNESQSNSLYGDSVKFNKIF